MYKFNRDGVSVRSIVDKRRRKNNGLYPIKIEVIYKRRQKYYSTGQDTSPDEWEAMWRMNRMHDKLVDVERIFHRARMAVEALTEKGRFCFAALDIRMGNVSATVNEAIERKMERLVSEGRVNSYYRYRNTLHAIEDYRGKRIAFDDIDVPWLKRCEAFWVKEGKNSTTISIYMNTLRCICREAAENGIMHEEYNPFRKGGYRIPTSCRRVMALSKEHIEMIVKWKGDRELCYWRDLWLFSYLCNGINFRDMLFLKYGNIADGEISFVRAKTATRTGTRIIKAAVTPLMEEIMERSGNGRTGLRDSMIFKHAKGSETAFEIARIVRVAIISCNRALACIADDLNIPHFTTYSARHSFATILKRGGVDIQFISESLGHASIKMTENYLAGFGREERLMNTRILTDF